MHSNSNSATSPVTAMWSLTNLALLQMPLLWLLLLSHSAEGQQNSYQQFYQNHFKNPHKQQHQYVHPLETESPPGSTSNPLSSPSIPEQASLSDSNASSSSNLPAASSPQLHQQQQQASQPSSPQQLLSQSHQQQQPSAYQQHQATDQQESIVSNYQQELQQQQQQYVVQHQWLVNSNSPQAAAVYPANGGVYPNSKYPSSNDNNNNNYLNTNKSPVYNSAQWGSNTHNAPHTHGGHVHAPHQHHSAHGYTHSRPGDADVDVFRRPYCQVRAAAGGQCCAGRQDSCYVPILDTVCYCDVFCNRTVADCCPDFWTWCMGIAPPNGAMGHGSVTASGTSSSNNNNFGQGHLPLTKKKTIVNNCKYKGQYYKPDSTVQINCNNCSCVEASMGTEYNWQCSQKICLIRKELIDHVSKGKFGWQSSNYTFFWGMTLDDGVRHKLGTKRPTKSVKQMTSMHVNINDVLPEHFDGREEWGDLLHPIQDQGNCGASWVFSTTGVAADRFSLHSGGAVTEVPSPQHLLSCNKDHMQHGCDGGHLDRAWWFLRKSGVVDAPCYPYRSGVTSEAGTCLIPSYKTASGPRVRCPTKSRRTSLVYQVAPPYRVAPSEREIMKEVMENGPVQATLEVKEDFFMYKGGVYRYSLPANILPPNHRTTGFHSVRILGWGIDKSSGRPLKYWLCANSWGRKWGEDGFFRIVRGQDECKIESFVVGVWGKLNGRPIIKARGSKTASKGFSKSPRPFSNKKRS